MRRAGLLTLAIGRRINLYEHRCKAQKRGGFVQTEFASDLGQRGTVAMAFGPHGSGQALYYTTGFNGGEVRRITSTGAVNRPPTAVVEANPTSGPSRSTSTAPKAVIRTQAIR